MSHKRIKERCARGLNKRHDDIRKVGAVFLSREVPLEKDDPMLEPFLSFLARDIANHPDALQSVDAQLMRRIQSLTDGIEVDFD